MIQRTDSGNSPQYRRLWIEHFAVSVFIAGMLLVAMFSVQVSDRARHEVTAGYARRSAINELILDLWRTQSSVRSSFAVQDPNYAREAKNGFSVIRERLVALRTVAGNTPHQREYVNELERLLPARVDLADKLLALDPHANTAMAEAKELIATGDQKTEEIERVVSRARKAELEHLEQAQERVDDAQTIAFGLLTGGSALALMFYVLAHLRVMRERRTRATLLTRLEMRGHQNAMLGKLGQSLQACQSVKEMEPVLSHYMEMLFPASTGAVYLMHESRNALALVCAWGTPASTAIGLIEPQDCWAMRHGTRYAIGPSERGLLCAHMSGYPSTGSLCLPMLANSEPLGLMTISYADLVADEAEPERLWLCETIVTAISAMFSNLRLRAVLRAQSIRDPLTDVFNRRFLEETMERELLRARRHSGVFGVIMLDIDNFKRYNDNQGHQAGDALLQAFAQLLKSSVRGEDIACRYGGEEFTLVLPGATLEITAARAERVRIASRALQVHFRGEVLPAVSVSLGVACYPAHGESWQEVLSKADGALYVAKAQGRDQVVTAAMNIALEDTVIIASVGDDIERVTLTG